MNLIERYAPRLALKQELARSQLKRLKIVTEGPSNAKGYENGGASRVKKAFRKWRTRNKQVDEELKPATRQLLQSRSADLYKNSTLGSAAIEKVVTNVVGPGLKLKSTIDAKFLNLDQEEKKLLEKKIETLWEMWTDTEACDKNRMSNFSELQIQFMYSWLIFGEGIAILPYHKRVGDFFSLKIQIIDSILLKTPSGTKKDIVNGVELDGNSEFSAIHIETQDPATKKKEIIRIPAFGEKTGRKNVLMLLDRKRPTQRVGVPLLAPVIEEIKQIADWQKSEIQAAVTSSLFTFFLKNESPETMTIAGRDEGDGEDNGDTKTIQQKIEPGSIYELAEGQDIEAPPSGRPVIGFDAFLMSITKTIGAAIEIPPEVLLSSFNSNYSASRAALLEVWKMYIKRRTRLKEKFCNPIFYEFMDEIVASGYIDIPGYFDNPLIKKAVLRNEWYGPIQGSIDPYKDAKADELDIKNMTKTRDKISRERLGTSFEQTIEQIAVEKQMIEEATGEKLLGDE